jgi:Tetratricopeptide repeat
MQGERFGLAMSLAAAVLVGALGVASLALAQSDAELEALNRQVISLSNAGKTAEAIPIAERYAEAIKARHGPEHPQYATALNNLAHVLQDTNRLRRASVPGIPPSPSARATWPGCCRTPIGSTRQSRSIVAPSLSKRRTPDPSIPQLPSASTVWAGCCGRPIGSLRPRH